MLTFAGSDRGPPLRRSERFVSRGGNGSETFYCPDRQAGAVQKLDVTALVPGSPLSEELQKRVPVGGHV